jgi:hypothetical protein
VYRDCFDQGEWTYACRFTPGGDSDADYAEHMRVEQEVAERAHVSGARLAIIIGQDRGYPAPNASLRKKIAAMTSMPTFRPVCCAIVTGNPILRGVITALNWLRKREYSEAIFGDQESALAWLEREGGRALPRLREMVRAWNSGPAPQ